MVSHTKNYDVNFPPLPTPTRRTRCTKDPVVLTSSTTSDAEEAASPPSPESEGKNSEVQKVQVYKGKDIIKAKQLCTKDSKGYQFLFYNSEKDKTTKLKTSFYKCVADECPCEMRMTTTIAPKGSKKGAQADIIVVEKHNGHKRKGEPAEHVPLASKNFRWDPDQKNFMSNFVLTQSNVTPSVLRQELIRVKKDNGAALQQVFLFLFLCFFSHTQSSNYCTT